MHLSPRYSPVTLINICLGHLTTNALSLHTNLARSTANQSANAIVAMKK